MIRETKPIQQLTESELIKRYSAIRSKQFQEATNHLNNLSNKTLWLSSTLEELGNEMRTMYSRALKPLVVSACNTQNRPRNMFLISGGTIKKAYVLSRLRRRYRKVFKSLKQQNLRAKNLK